MQGSQLPFFSRPQRALKLYATLPDYMCVHLICCIRITNFEVVTDGRYTVTTVFCASPPAPLLLPSSARSEIARNSSRLQVRALNMLHTYYKFRSKSLMRANAYK